MSAIISTVFMANWPTRMTYCIQCERANVLYYVCSQWKWGFNKRGRGPWSKSQSLRSMNFTVCVFSGKPLSQGWSIQFRYVIQWAPACCMIITLTRFFNLWSLATEGLDQQRQARARAQKMHARNPQSTGTGSMQQLRALRPPIINMAPTTTDSRVKELEMD